MLNKKIAALAFVDETNKIAATIKIPINLIEIKEAASFIEDFIEKNAATRAVKEWRASSAAGDTGTADSIAKGYGQLGLKPRYLDDVSLGGAEAGVDRMMGDARQSTGQMPSAQTPGVSDRLNTMKANKSDLGLGGRLSTPSVRSSSEGRDALLRGTQPTPSLGANPNESGYMARKMYKPDSYISQAEFTPQHVQQKMDMTQAARSLSPEAKSMVPDMYGYKTQGAGPTQRTMSYHEYVPGMSDLREHPQAKEQAKASIRDQVINPLQQKGMLMGDVTSARGTNWGNIAMGGDGKTKVVDFLPSIAGEASHASRSFQKYAPMPEMRHSLESGVSKTVGDLRKEMYKPTMQSLPASPDQVAAASRAHEARMTPTPSPAAQAPTVPAAPKPQPAPIQTMTRPASPGAMQAATPPSIRPQMAPKLSLPPTRPVLGGLHR